jgi:hypothetical protein
MASVNSLVSGVAQVKEEVRVLKRIRISPQGDRFILVMEVRSPLLRFLVNPNANAGSAELHPTSVWSY